MFNKFGRAAAVAGCVLGLWTLPATTQPFGTDLMSVDAGGRLWRTGSAGTAQSLVVMPLPSHGLCMHHDNETFVFTQSTTAETSQTGIYAYNPVTMQTSTVFASSLFVPYDVVQNADGDYVFTGYARSGAQRDWGLFKFDATQSFSTIATTAQLGVTLSTLNSGVSININTGNYLVVAGAFPNIGSQFVWDIDDDGTFTTIGTTGNSRYSHVQDLRTGDLYISGFQTVFVLEHGEFNHKVYTTGPSNFYALAADRVSDPDVGLVARTATQVLTIDLKNDTVTSVTTNPSGSTTFEAVWDRSRNISTVKTGAATWDIKLDFPGEGGRLYLLGLSVTGTRPPTTIPSDGRKLFLNMDVLSDLTVNNLLHGIFHPGPGMLDANGRATARLNLAALPVIRTPIFMVAATFRQGGFGTITSPTAAKFVREAQQQ